jgi:phospholipid/cholesterol/gamma-HCH transport system ATP-binding protein
MDEPKIRIRSLRKSFGRKLVLDGLDLEVGRGESVVIIGGSGSGKSVLLKHVIGLLRPDAGIVEVDGKQPQHLGNREITEFRRKFGMSFQEGALFDSMTVRQNIAFPLTRLRRLTRAQIAARVDDCLDMVHLERDAGEKMPAQLSGGMRRRVGFARAIAHEPDILLFDEPTTGLDPVTTAVVGEVIEEIRERTRATTLTISHDMQSAFKIGDRIAMLLGGKIIAAAPPGEFQRLPDPRVQQFLRGSSRGPLTEAAG